MARVTLRVPDQMKTEMDAHEDINWSEHIRRAIRDRLGGSPSRDIQKLVAEYQTDLDKLWVLHMYSTGVSKRDLYRTAECIFGEDKDDVVDEVGTALESRGLDSMYERIEEGHQVGDTIQSAIASAGSSQLTGHVKKAIKDAPKKIRDGVYVLSLHLRDSLERESAHIHPEAIERTWGQFSDTDGDIDDLVELGLVYVNYYSSNAYGHWWYKVPDYALEVLEELAADPSAFGIYRSPPSRTTLQTLVGDEDSREFLKWMGGSTHYVSTYDEDEEIEADLADGLAALSLADFKRVRSQLVQDSILLFEYSPHRSSTGSRSSRPSRWRYELTQPTLDNLPEILLEDFSITDS